MRAGGDGGAKTRDKRGRREYGKGKKERAGRRIFIVAGGGRNRKLEPNKN